MPDKGRLVHAAVTVRSQAPEAWEMFLQAMREYAAAATAEMVTAAPELLLRAQGIAYAAHEIATTLREAPQLNEKFQGLRNARTNERGRGF